MNSTEQMKMAAYQELQEALKVKRINDELLDFLSSSVRWILHYTKNNNMDIPDKDRIIDILDKAMKIEDRYPLKIQTS